MKVVFFLFLLLYLLANFYVFQRAWVLMPPVSFTRIILVVLAVLSVSSIFIFFVLGEHLPIPVSSFFYLIGTSWLFIFLYFFILTLIKDIIRFTPLVPTDLFSHYTRDNWVGFCLAVGFVGLLMISGYMKYRWKIRVEVPVAMEKQIQNRDSLKIVALSDLHLGYGIGKNEFKSWVSLINKENPDIVLIAGDIIDNSIRPLEHSGVAEYFKEIKAPLGVYTCPGNHEYISGLQKSLNFLNEAGVKVLRDEAVLVDSSFYVVGRDDRSNPNRKSLEELTRNLNKSYPVFVLDHQPYHLEEAEQSNVDLLLCGHTHRGQVWPISLITDYIYEVSHGYKKKGNTNIYVSSGIGLWGGKFRIGTQSEYAVINIKNEE